MRLRSLHLAPLAAMVLLLLAGPATPTAAGAALERGIVYASPGDRPLTLDLERPARTPARGAPAIVWVHGGGFTAGSRRSMASYVHRSAAAGYVGATIAYRLLPHETVRRLGLSQAGTGARQDTEAAIAFLRRHAAAYGIDPARIVVAGVSAGAITALDVAAQGLGDARVQAAVSLAGFAPPGRLGPVDPPLLLINGTLDRAVPVARARATCAEARAVRVRCDLQEVAGRGHRTLLAERDANTDRVLRWLAQIGLAP